MLDHERLHPKVTQSLAQRRGRLAPGPAEAFRTFNQSVIAEGAEAERGAAGASEVDVDAGVRTAG